MFVMGILSIKRLKQMDVLHTECVHNDPLCLKPERFTSSLEMAEVCSCGVPGDEAWQLFRVR